MRRAMKAFAICALAAGLAPGCASTAPKQETTVAQSEGEPADPEEELVCRREHRTGTNISKKVCYTREQLDEHAVDRREKDQNALQDSHRYGCQGGGCSQGGGGPE